MSASDRCRLSDAQARHILTTAAHLAVRVQISQSVASWTAVCAARPSTAAPVDAGQETRRRRCGRFGSTRFGFYLV
jgi:hypothetical protein